jgi:hypothetical protein
MTVLKNITKTTDLCYRSYTGFGKKSLINKSTKDSKEKF